MAARIACVAMSILAAGCSTLSDLRNPSIRVPVEHPPGIGLEVTEVAFAPPAGNCSNAVVGWMSANILFHNVVLGSDLVVVETPAGLAGDTETAAEWIPGQLLLSLRDTVCQGERNDSSRQVKRVRKKKREVDGEEEEYEEEYYVTKNTRTTVFTLGVAVRAAELQTGRVVASWEVDEAVSDSNTAEDATPSYPTEAALRFRAVRRAGNEVAEWLLPWTEHVSLTFFDAQECGMEVAYAHVEAEDLDGAAVAAVRSIDLCRSEQAGFQAAARYNAGMVEFLRGDYVAALERFDDAAAIDPENERIGRAAAEVVRAKALRDEILEIYGR